MTAAGRSRGPAARRDRQRQDRALSPAGARGRRRGPRRRDAGAGDRPDARPCPARSARVFGDRVAIQHSGLSDGERHDQWHRIRRGDVDVVVGTRSAVFAPVQRLGLIIVDEEHDSSYKQEESPRYNGRDVAVMRARAGRRGGGARLRHAVARELPQRADRPLRADHAREARARSADGRRHAWSTCGASIAAAGPDVIVSGPLARGDRGASRAAVSRRWCCSTAAASPPACSAVSAARRSIARTAASR